MDNLHAYLFLLSDSFFTSLMFIPRLAYVGDSMIALGGFNAYLVFIISFIAGVAGSCVNWVFGLYFRKLENIRTFAGRQSALLKAESAFNRKYKWILLLSCIAFWGPLFNCIAGVLRFRFSHFLILVAFSKFVGLSIDIFFS
jgi:membrane protein YqaA with SNARE-associated domain